MGYPTLRAAIEKMIMNRVLDMQIARDIVRKAGAWPTQGGSAAGEGAAAITLWTHSDVNESAYGSNGVALSGQRGWVSVYPASSNWQPFPYADSIDVLSATVTDFTLATEVRISAYFSAAFDGRLWAATRVDGGLTNFVDNLGENPEEPSVGDTGAGTLMWSGWFPILDEWKHDNVELHVVVNNASGSTQDLGVGLIQVQAR